MPSQKQLTAKLPTLKQLKAQFTDLTGIPANKANAYAVCSGVEGRKMTTKADWDFALSNIIPEKTLKYQQDTIKDLITVLESQTEKLLELNSLYEAELQNHQDDEAISKLKIENEKLKASADAFKQSNELYSEDFHKQLDEIEQLKAENERLKAMDKDSDEVIARLRNEIKFLNGELAKSMKKPMREIQLEKRVQDLEDEVYDLQRELRKVRNTETASLDSLSAIDAFSNFCFALPLEWVEVFVRSYLANSSDLKATYRELSRKFHPDTNHSIKSGDLFRTLRDCYEDLKDSRKLAMSCE